MKNIKKRFVMVIGGMLAVLLLPLEVALADPAKEMGCITRDPDTAKLKFMGGDHLDKKTIREAIINARSHVAKVADPCQMGQVRNIPASVYAALADQHPEKFQTFESNNQRDASPLKRKKGKVPHEAPQYQYAGIFEAVPPEILLFDPIALTNDDRIYGTAFTEFFEEPPFFTAFAAVFDRGELTVLKGSKGIIAVTANKRNTIGGSVITDFENFFSQAVLFQKNKIQLIPRLPNEIHSEMIKVNDHDVALIRSFDENFNGKLALYENGKLTPLDLGANIVFPFFLSMNNKGIISGTTSIDGVGDRGFRFDPRTGVATLLEPLSTETHSWTMGINNHDDVLGYSFEFGAIERIGVWDKHGKFHTYFVEGIPEFPTISNALRFNDHNLIAITDVSNPPNERGNTYLVPKPGVRLNLVDLVTGAPPGLFLFVDRINDHGNLLGSARPQRFEIVDFFFLERTDHGGK